MTGAAARGVHKAGLSIHIDESFHIREALVALLAGVHLRVTRPIFVFGRRRRCNQGGIDCGFCFKWRAGELLELGKLVMRRSAEERFFHAGGKPREALPHEAAAQHRRQSEGRLANTVYWLVRGDQFDQRGHGSN